MIGSKKKSGRAKRFLFATPILVLMGVTLSGCFVSREISHVRRDIERTWPEAEFDREFVVSVGPGLFNTLGWMAYHSQDEDGIRFGQYLSDIRRVKVGVFNVRSLPEDEVLDIPSLARFVDDGWMKAAVVRDRGETIWALYRERHNAVRDMFFLVLDPDELVIVRVEGNLSRLLARVVEDELFTRDLFDSRKGKRKQRR